MFHHSVDTFEPHRTLVTDVNDLPLSIHSQIRVEGSEYVTQNGEEIHVLAFYHVYMVLKEH